MRHLALILLTICSLAISAGNSLSIPTLSGRPGDELTVSVGFDCTDAPTAIEVLVPLGEYISYVSGSAMLSSARSNGHTLMANAANDTLYVHIFSMSLQPLRGTTGELFSFQIRLGEEPQVWSLNPSIVASNSTGQAVSVTKTPGQVTTLAPKIEIVTPTIDYGHQPIRQTYTKTIQLKNVGTEDLTVSSLVMPSADFSYDGQPRTIAPGATTSVTMQYAPVQRGAYSGTLYVNSNAVNAALRANSQIKVLADPFSVNELRIGSASGVSDETATVSVRINNMEPLCGIQFSIALPSQLEYVDGSAALSNRAAALQLVASCTNNTLTLMAYSFCNAAISGDDGEVLTFQVRLNGSNGSYSLKPNGVVLSNSSSENMVSATYGGTVSIQSPRYSGANTLSFAEAPVTESARASYSIRNTSSQPLTISGISFVGNASEFSISETFPVVIAGNSSKSITVVHTPTVEGSFSTIMQVYNNDPIDRMHSVTVSGKVYEPNSISLSGENTDEGYLLHIGLDNYSNVVALQLDVNWLDGFETELRATARTASQQNSIYNLGDGTYRVMSFSMSNQAVSGHSGELFSILFKGKKKEDYNQTIISLDSVLVSDANSSQRLSSSLPELEVQSLFSVCFLDYDNSLLDQQMIAFGGAAIAPEEPIREGYTFTGWLPNDFSYITHDLSVVAQYEYIVPTRTQPLSLESTPTKILRDGQVLILRGDRLFDLRGQEVK